MGKANEALSQMMSGPDDQRIAAEGVVQRIAGLIVMQEKFALT